MSSAQLAANRSNAQRSTGPRTESGKQRVRLNAFRHGLTGQVCLVTPEDRQAFEAHCKGIRESLAPSGALELDLAQSIAEDRWRLKRARALENAIFALEIAGGPELVDATDPQVDAAFAQGRAWLANGCSLQLLSLYEQRIQRSLGKNLAQLQALQTARREACRHTFEETQLLSILADRKGLAYDPIADFVQSGRENGFDFSNVDFGRLTRRTEALDEARFHAANRWDENGEYPGPARLPGVGR